MSEALRKRILTAVPLGVATKAPLPVMLVKVTAAEPEFLTVTVLETALFNTTLP